MSQSEDGRRDPDMRRKLVNAAKAYKLEPHPSYPNALLQPLPPCPAACCGNRWRIT